MITATPALAPFPVADFLRPTTKEQSKIAQNSGCQTEGPCSVPVHIALFFDGTNNNLYRDKDGVKVGVPEGKKPPVITRKPVPPHLADHSNIARLFLAFPYTVASKGIFRVYIPGPGTPFPEIGEPTETQEGKAFAKGGQPRILWALLQALNSIHGVIKDEPLYDDSEVGALVKEYDRLVGTAKRDADGEQVRITHRGWFGTHIEKLTKVLETPKPKIPSVTLSVFGFSRGAAEAAAFCHMFDEILDNGTLAGIPAEIGFLGVFDTVASVGGSASVARTMPVPGALFDGHWSWANRILKSLPSCVKAGRHFIASQEVRMNFPVTRLRAESGNFQEVYFPGMHSDVGGGYGPGDFGKGRGAQSALVSQIPLVHMYKEARLAGVPFTPFSELDQGVKDDYAINEKLASAWNAYTTELGQNGGILKKHMELYYRWRAARLKTLEETASFKAANEQAQQDMQDANRMLAGDLEALEYRRTAQPKTGDDAYEPFTPYDLARINQWHYYRAQNRTPLDEWEAWALSIFRAPQPLPAEVMRFFDDYIHDSFAGFYMAGEVTEYDRRKKISEVVKQDRRRLKGFDLKVYDLAKETEVAVIKRKAGEKLTDKEEKLADQAESGTPYPKMTDADTSDMRSAAITTQTSTRREGGGYILMRGNYPEKGFFRRSIYDEELQRMPKVGDATTKTTRREEEFELVWSDDLPFDLFLIASNAAGIGHDRTKAREDAIA